jgi:hypothetical protein
VDGVEAVEGDGVLGFGEADQEGGAGLRCGMPLAFGR